MRDTERETEIKNGDGSKRFFCNNVFHLKKKMLRFLLCRISGVWDDWTIPADQWKHPWKGIYIKYYNINKGGGCEMKSE